MRKTFCAVLAVLALCLSSGGAAWGAGLIDVGNPSGSTPGDWSFNNGVFSVHGDVTITGTTTVNHVAIGGYPTPNVTLKDVSIDASGFAIILMENWGNSNLTLVGTNVLRGSLAVLPGATLTITDNSTGSLEVTSGEGLAGIGGYVAPFIDGGGYALSAGIINVAGGTIVATGGPRGAGIGGGGSGAVIAINITGGTIIATGGNGAAGIGGGGGRGGVGAINITGGTVIATGGNGAAGIGEGIEGFRDGWSGIAPIINIADDANVTAVGGGPSFNNISGAGIGGSGNAPVSDATINITGGTIQARSGDNSSQALRGTVNAPNTPYTWTASTSVTGANPITGVFPGTPFINNTSFSFVNLQAPMPNHSILLSASGNKNFGSETAGYGTQTPYSVTINNTGNMPTGTLTVSLSGANQTAFTLSKTSIPSIAKSGNDSFTVRPNTGLAAGEYTATVTVSGLFLESRSFNVSFTVNDASSYGGSNGSIPGGNGNDSGCNIAAGLLTMLLVLPLLFKKKK